MMGFVAINEKAHSLFEEASFLSEICNDSDYEQISKLMDELIGDYDKRCIDIGILCFITHCRHSFTFSGYFKLCVRFSIATSKSKR